MKNFIFNSSILKSKHLLGHVQLAKFNASKRLTKANENDSQMLVYTSVE